MSQQIDNINTSIEKITKKDFGIYFFTLDTKGNPTAGVATIYEHVKILRELGFNATILHDKKDYKLREDENGQGIAEWLGEEYITSLYRTCHDGKPYIQNQVPLVQDPKIFDEELSLFVDDHTKNWSFREPFLQTVARPMSMAFYYHKTKRDYITSEEYISRIVKADDWRIAATNWIKKREALVS